MSISFRKVCTTCKGHCLVLCSRLSWKQSKDVSMRLCHRRSHHRGWKFTKTSSVTDVARLAINSTGRMRCRFMSCIDLWCLMIILDDTCHPSQVRKIHSLESASNVPLAKTMTCAKLATTTATLSTLNIASIECLRHSALSFLWFAMDVGRRRFNQKIASSAWNVQTTTCVLRVLMIAAASTHIILHGSTRDRRFALHLLRQLSQNPKRYWMRTGIFAGNGKRIR